VLSLHHIGQRRSKRQRTKAHVTGCSHGVGVASRSWGGNQSTSRDDIRFDTQVLRGALAAVVRDAEGGDGERRQPGANAAEAAGGQTRDRAAVGLRKIAEPCKRA
jgi:hypothetical protein